MKDQSQSVGDGATAYQTTGNITIIGVSAGEARQIALDVFQANMLQLQSEAVKTVRKRAEEITDKFLLKLQAENPAGIEKARDPDFQDALFTVQKEHAKAGDTNLGDLLVDLLVDRSKTSHRDLVQLVLSESIHTAPKLTSKQINTLSIVFFFRYVTNNNLRAIVHFAEFAFLTVGPLLDHFVHSSSTFAHLQFTGCGHRALGSLALEEIWQRQYTGFFKIGFDENRLLLANLQPSTRLAVIGQSMHDALKFQVKELTIASLEARLKMLGNVPVDEQERVKALFNEGTMDHAKIKEVILAAAPFLADLLDSWRISGLGGFELTSVGMAIGHANIKRVIGEFAPLSIWLDETTVAV